MVSLKLVTKVDLNKPSIKRLTDWRIQNSFAYTGNYEVTEDSVQQWLETKILNFENRILYWVVCDDFEYIGHIGLNNIQLEIAEISDVSRGISNHKGAMGEALNMVAAPYQYVWLRVLPTNSHAIRFYERNGFSYRDTMGEFLKYERFN